MAKEKIIIKTPEQIKNISVAGQYHRELMLKLQAATQPWIALIELEQIAQDFLSQKKLIWSFKGYSGFPANLCLSVNDCLVHGIPDKYVLKSGDLLKIDAWVTYKKGIADAAISIVVGGDYTNTKAAQLVETTKNGLDECIKNIEPWRPIYDFSKAIRDYMTTRGFSCIKVLTGHGVGVKVHEAPYIYNRPHKDTKKVKRQPGMVVAIEPITAITSDDYVEKPWNHRNLYTRDGDLGAQREYTLAITENGFDILAGIK